MIREGNPVWPRLSHYPDPSRRPAPRGPCPLRMTILRRTPDPNRSPSERTHLPLPGASSKSSSGRTSVVAVSGVSVSAAQRPTASSVLLLVSVLSAPVDSGEGLQATAVWPVAWPVQGSVLRPGLRRTPARGRGQRGRKPSECGRSGLPWRRRGGKRRRPHRRLRWPRFTPTHWELSSQRGVRQVR